MGVDEFVARGREAARRAAGRNGKPQYEPRPDFAGEDYPWDPEPDAPPGQEKRRPKGKPGELVCRRLSEVKAKPVSWLVPGLVPLGKLTMIAGDGGHGKSSTTLDLIACL